MRRMTMVFILLKLSSVNVKLKIYTRDGPNFLAKKIREKFPEDKYPNDEIKISKVFDRYLRDF